MNFPPHEELEYLTQENVRLRRELKRAQRLVDGLKDRLSRAGVVETGFVDDLPSTPMCPVLAVGREEFYVYRVVAGEHLKTEDRLHIAQSLGERFARQFAEKTVSELGSRVPLNPAMFDDAYYESLR